MPQLDDADGGDAIRLLYHLERAHWDRDELPFAESLGWTPKRFLKARGKLVDAGLLIQLTPGGRFKGDAPLFAWPNIFKKKKAA